MKIPIVAIALASTCLLSACPEGWEGRGERRMPEGSDKVHEGSSLSQRAPLDRRSSPSQVDEIPSRNLRERSPLLESRPYKLGAPSGLSATEPAPLVIYLHGYGSSGSRLLKALEIDEVARAEKFLYAIPEGTREVGGRRFWNATPACCNFQGAVIDDVAYIEAIIDDVRSKTKVDERRIYVSGFSNGGFMAHRIACELSERIAGVAAVAGVNFLDESRCRPSRPVSVLQIHGLDDDIIAFDGGHALGNQKHPAHPSVSQTISSWGRLNKCSAEPISSGSFDLEDRLHGNETSVLRYEHCQRGSAVELWKVSGGSHFVAFGGRATQKIYEFFKAHPQEG